MTSRSQVQTANPTQPHSYTSNSEQRIVCCQLTKFSISKREFPNGISNVLELHIDSRPFRKIPVHVAKTQSVHLFCCHRFVVVYMMRVEHGVIVDCISIFNWIFGYGVLWCGAWWRLTATGECIFFIFCFWHFWNEFVSLYDEILCIAIERSLVARMREVDADCSIEFTFGWSFVTATNLQWKQLKRFVWILFLCRLLFYVLVYSITHSSKYTTNFSQKRFDQFKKWSERNCIQW